MSYSYVVNEKLQGKDTYLYITTGTTVESSDRWCFYNQIKYFFYLNYLT